MGRGGIDEGDPAGKNAPSEDRHHRYSPFESETVFFISVSVSAHCISQLNDPVQIAPASTLAQRVPSPIIDFSVELEEPTDKISDVFPKHLGHNLHIIVKLRRKRIY